ncbi:MAG: hypothetical protein QUU85_00770 [Candidatus Eisenbacteria bacterium]|nr:hypothetical protein [Candidatus Eisenbacteria bacterium]
MNRAPLLLAALMILLTRPAFAITWEITTVDGPGDVGAYASIALDPSGRPAISYCASATDDLKFARFDGVSWHAETVDAANRTGWYTSLAFDASGDPRIAYWDLSASALRYARWSAGTWTKETVDNAAYVGQCCSLALDHSGNPCISYYDYTNGDLKYARFDGVSWHIEVVEDGAAGMGAGLYTSLALDSQDRPHISHADHTTGQLRYAHWDGAQWIRESVDGGTPIGTSIALDENDVPRISYAYQFGQGSHLKYASRTGPGDTWVTQIVRPGGQKGLYSSLRLVPGGDPRILSWDLGNGIVQYNSYEDGGWIHEDVEAMGWTDQWCSLALDAQSRPHAAYRSATEQDLHYACDALASGLTDPFAPEPGSPAFVLRSLGNPSDIAGTVTLRLDLEHGATVRLSVVGVTGRQVAEPVTQTFAAGASAFTLPADLPAGVYLVRAEGDGGQRAALRVVLMR